MQVYHNFPFYIKRAAGGARGGPIVRLVPQSSPQPTLPSAPLAPYPLGLSIIVTYYMITTNLDNSLTFVAFLIMWLGRGRRFQ